jgi:hypothetical protein
MNDWSSASPYAASEPDEALPSVPSLTNECISKFERCAVRYDGDDAPIPLENRLADLRLWTDESPPGWTAQRRLNGASGRDLMI